VKDSAGAEDIRTVRITVTPAQNMIFLPIVIR
jgi:hypothetical protein